jgi:chromosome segregation ATPase
MVDINVQEFGEYKNRVKSLEHRMNSVEDLAKTIYDQNVTLKELVVEVRHTNENIKDHENRLDKIENKDSEVIASLKKSIISAIAGSVVTLIFSVIVWVLSQKGGI